MSVMLENVLIVELSLSYNKNATYGPIVSQYLANSNTKIHAGLYAAGLGHLVSHFIYLNDPDGGRTSLVGTQRQMCERRRGLGRSMTQTGYSKILCLVAGRLQITSSSRIVEYRRRRSLLSTLVAPNVLCPLISPHGRAGNRVLTES